MDEQLEEQIHEAQLAVDRQLGDGGCPFCLEIAEEHLANLLKRRGER